MVKTRVLCLISLGPRKHNSDVPTLQRVTGSLQVEALNLTVCCAVQNRRMEQGQQAELKVSKQSPACRRRRPRLPRAPVWACCTCRRPPCVWVFYQDSGLIPAAATRTATRTAKVAWTQSCCCTPGLAGPPDKHTPDHTGKHSTASPLKV